MSYEDTTSLHSQHCFIEPTHPPSIDSDNPSWATLSAENTSGDEDALESESKATTPEPVEEKALSSYTTTSHIKAAPSTLFLYQQPSASPASHSISTTSKNQSRGLKRWPSPDSLSPHVSPAKKTKAHSLGHSDHTLLNCHPPSTYQNGIVILPRKSTTTWAAPPVHLTAPQRQHHTPFSSHGIHAASLPSTLTHQALRPRKPLLPITDSSSIKDWALVDDALHTQIASVHILHRSTQFPAPWEPEGAMDAKWVGGAHIPLTQFADLEKGSKGKERARSGWTAPRWSNVGDFKARLDTMYGPGDINRGLGRGPKNIPVGTAPDQPALVGLPDPGAAQGSALTEDEDEPDMSLEGMRRGRLENPSPQRDTRASRRHGASGKSPEIE